MAQSFNPSFNLMQRNNSGSGNSGNGGYNNGNNGYGNNFPNQGYQGRGNFQNQNFQQNSQHIPRDNQQFQQGNQMQTGPPRPQGPPPLRYYNDKILDMRFDRSDPSGMRHGILGDGTADFVCVGSHKAGISTLTASKRFLPAWLCCDPALYDVMLERLEVVECLFDLGIPDEVFDAQVAQIVNANRRLKINPMTATMALQRQQEVRERLRSAQMNGFFQIGSILARSCSTSTTSTSTCF